MGTGRFICFWRALRAPGQGMTTTPRSLHRKTDGMKTNETEKDDPWTRAAVFILGGRHGDGGRESPPRCRAYSGTTAGACTKEPKQDDPSTRAVAICSCYAVVAASCPGRRKRIEQTKNKKQLTVLRRQFFGHGRHLFLL